MSTMVKVKTAELTGAALNWAVAQVLGFTVKKSAYDTDFWHCEELCQPYWYNGPVEDYKPSSDWSHGGPLVDALMKTGKWEVVQSVTAGEVAVQNYNSECVPVDGKDWDADILYFSSKSLLIAFCRAFVASERGEEVEVPQDLVEVGHGV